MTTAAAKQTRFKFGPSTPKGRPRESVSLREHIACADMAGRIDRDAKVIRGVKIAGLVSANGRRYTESCMREAVPLYEGARVYDAHFQQSEDSPRAPHDRPMGEWIGVVRNVRFERDGLYADLHYLESNSVSAILLEAVERFPDRLGMSPHVLGVRNERDEITQITKVFSVDLVRAPATVAGMFESDQTGEPMKKKFRDIVAGSPAGTPGLTVLQEMLSDVVLAEMDVALDTAAGVPAPMDELAAAFAAAVAAVMNSAEPIDAKKAKLLALLKAQEQVAAKPEEKPAAEADDGEEEEESESENKESVQTDAKLQARLEALERENAQHKATAEVRELFESARVTPTANQIAAAVALQGDARKAFVAETIETLRESESDGLGLPRSGPRRSPGSDATSTHGGYPQYEPGEFARACR